MQSQLFILTFISVLHLVACAPPNWCTWTDSYGNSYDLNPLHKKPYWTVQDKLASMGVFSMKFKFNFCNIDGLMCQNRRVSVFEELDVNGQMTDNCDVMASSESPSSKSYIDNDPDKGLSLVFTGGDPCGNLFSSATFKLYCADHQDDWILDASNACTPTFTQNTRYACKDYLKGGFFGVLFQWSIIGFILYLIGGFIYNVQKADLTGVEAIPHIDVFRNFPEKAQEGINYAAEQVQRVINRVQTGQWDQQGYTTV